MGCSDSMRPRHADVAFVLEGVGGVRALYAIDPGKRAARHFDLAVELAPGGRALAEAHYALVRVMTHEDCARVFVFHTTAPQIIAEAVRPLRLTESEREAARRRVPPVPPRQSIVPARAAATVPDPVVLVVGDDAGVERAVTEVLATPGRSVVVANARWRLQGRERILTKPLEAWVPRERITRVGAVSLLWAPDLARVVAVDAPPRSLTCPPPSAPFTVLLADVDDDVHQVLRRIFREEARHMMRSDPEAAAELALSAPFHVLLCSAKAALHPRSFLDGIGREDPKGADRVLVVAAARDVPYVKHKLERMGRKNTVLAASVDETTLRREVFRDHPTLTARVAVAEIAGAEAPQLGRLRFRRLAALVVDDDPTTEILFAAAGPRDDADVTLATSPMEAFEHVMSRPVDLLIVSATMRGDGGEPFYRVLWRLKPELKSRCVLAMASDAVPASAPQSKPSRIVERPLTRDAIGRVVETFGRP